VLIEPKEITLPLPDGTEKTYLLSKFPAVAGREIVAKYPLSNMPAIGDYQVSEEIMLKLMAYVAVPRAEGEPLRLTTRALVDNHVTSWETLARLELAMMEYNCSFFTVGKISNFSDALGQKATAWITGTVIPLLQQSLQKGAQPSTSSERSTR